MSERRPPNESLYDTLGVDADATDTAITTAYRRPAREHHPDTNPAANAGAFSDVTDAYDVLHDPARRSAYDDTRQARGRAAKAAAAVRIPVRHVAQPTATPRPHIQAQPPAPPPDVDLHLSFDQAALGTTVVVAVDTDEPCPACAGTGQTPTTVTACDGCRGTGATTRNSGGITIRTECSRCAGSGHPDSELTGVVRVAPHPYFTRSGNDLHLRVPVTIAEGALGAVITVPTLDDAVAIRLPPGTPTGRTLRIRGRGVATGDLLATIDVVIPAELNDRRRAALEAFADATDLPRRHLTTR